MTMNTLGTLMVIGGCLWLLLAAVGFYVREVLQGRRQGMPHTRRFHR